MALVIGTNNIFFSETLDAADGVTGAADSVFGLGGSDHIFGLGGDDWLFGGDGEDTLWGGVGGDHLYGGDDRDLLYGGDGEDDLHGDDGHDVLLGGNDGDTLDGGEGHDLAYYTDSIEAVHISLAGITAWGGTAEGDTLSNIEDLAGSIFDDELEGDDEDNWLHGNFGDDTLTGGANGFGGDWLIGGYGIDTASYEHSPQGVRVSLLDDTAFFGHAEGDELDEIENLTGSAFADLLVGDNDANELTGLGGADTLDGGGGADTMIGGTGDDHYYVDDAGDVVTEYAFGGFDDTVNAGISYTLDVTVENLVLLGSAAEGTGNKQNNRITGNDRDNVLRGRGGADTLDGGDGADTMFGGTGDDTYTVDDAADAARELRDEGTDTVNAKISYELGAEVENLKLMAGFGAVEGTGNDRDTLDGGDGADIMIGGGGYDTYIVDDAADVVTEAIGEGFSEGFDLVETSVDYALAAGSEVEVLYADPAGTTAIALVGNEFDNVIVGHDGQNTLGGGLGRDTLIGHGDLDIMTGNDNGDTFVWTSTDETGVAGQEADVVMDFNRADGDLLDVSQIDADATDGAFEFVGIVDVTAGGSFTAPGQIGYFTADTDGNGVADQTYILLNTEVDAGIDYQDATIHLVGGQTVDASWFVL
jgi:Ca2+-binding RTX toxin-like protein